MARLRPRVTSNIVLVLLPVVLCVSQAVPVGATAPSPTPASSARVPLLAYYYIWYDVKSWDRAKSDYPQLGRYSSDDTEIMRQQIRWAKQAGIDGFIVSWKNTEVLSRRLERLVRIAEEEKFKLAIIYQGLDFERKPIDVARVAADLDYFSEHYADNPVFAIFDRPLVIWSGTWEFSAQQISSVTSTRRNRLLILASERNADDYQKKADLVDGDAYYWSSVDPSTYPGYPEKLREMADAVHAAGGKWIAPAAPGFDARLVGGKRVVDRQGGATLRTEMAAALGSAPDVVGLISWNEFSENSHVEPSCAYGTQTLAVLADLRGGSAPTAVPDHCADQSTTGSDAAGLVGNEPTVDNGTTQTPPRSTATPSPWPTPLDAASFIDPRRAGIDLDVDSSSPGGTDHSRGRWLLIASLPVIGLCSLLLVLFRARRDSTTGGIGDPPAS